MAEAGQTVPLGMTFAGIALLSWHEPDAVEAQLLANEQPCSTADTAAGRDFHDTLAAVRREIAQVQDRGYCFDKDTVMQGVSGMAAPIPSKTATPYMAITLSAINDRLPAQRVEELAPLLLEAAREAGAFIR
ncbi:IclR family transcriptional regulator domain-containing protein [Nocardia pseudobrasiliensis]|uniref:IclR family transcriptional regulator domain-containing protein n=1 Tax=Nocardia pseudobrasiliensis TaxID=45979 RepID=UPI0020D2659A|nr:IclR family transcriptional regulator C-terminal domain-containing protein [Nocardia pseudobrasiliensis]